MCMVIVRWTEDTLSIQRTDMPGRHYLFPGEDDEMSDRFALDIYHDEEEWNHTRFGAFEIPAGPVIGYCVDGEYYVR